MSPKSPIVFEPRFMERVWGGRRLEGLLGKHLPPAVPVGESWELVDRAEFQSVVTDGPLRGTTLHQLWTGRRAEIFGEGLPDTARFPLLLKFLDCEDRLSVQVHPSASVAARLGGEPKTEMWFFMHTTGESCVFAGLKRGVTRPDFEKAIEDGTVAEFIRRLPTKAGDAIFIPSGRVHAIGAGNVIFEVQQNSDTTYRAFDWNRPGLDGKPRALHIAESLASIDFDDTEAKLAAPRAETLVACEYFHVERWEIAGTRASETEKRFAVFTVTDGTIECGGRRFVRGDVFLVPVGSDAGLTGTGTVLRTTI
jgi:mannose-6-phosphate isomerase